MPDAEKRTIGDWRRRIDELDADLIRLLNERARCAVAIGKIKRSLGLAVYDPRREDEVIKLMLDLNAGPLDAQGVRRLFERIMDESRRIERLTIDD
jgi:chorismate mutase